MTNKDLQEKIMSNYDKVKETLTKYEAKVKSYKDDTERQVLQKVVTKLRSSRKALSMIWI